MKPLTHNPQPAAARAGPAGPAGALALRRVV